MSEKTGPKTALTDGLFKQIKECILDGYNLKETAEELFNKQDKFNNLEGEEREKELANFIQKIYNWKWDNYLYINDKIEGWKRDRKIILATKNLEDYLKMETGNVVAIGDEDYVKTDTGLERIKADMTKFTLETLDKENYSKRNELTGKDGDSLIPNKEEKKKSTEAIKQYLNDNKKEDNSTNTGE